MFFSSFVFPHVPAAYSSNLCGFALVPLDTTRVWDVFQPWPWSRSRRRTPRRSNFSSFCASAQVDWAMPFLPMTQGSTQFAASGLVLAWIPTRFWRRKLPRCPSTLLRTPMATCKWSTNMFFLNISCLYSAYKFVISCLQVGLTWVKLL